MTSHAHPARMVTTLFVLGALASFALVFSEAAGRAAPKNPHGGFQEECGQCHSPEAWTPARIPQNFDHARFGLPLAGAHRNTPCASCHTSLDFSKDRTPCAGCHEDVHRGELGADCAGCHSTRSFIDRSRMEKQHQVTRFPLTGTHLTLDCESCHPGAASGQLSFVQTPVECEACHRDLALAVTDPDHSDPMFAIECSHCHGTVSWDRAVFDHDGTRFPLSGAHLSLECSSCHTPGSWSGLPVECAGCHQDDYDATTDPNHRDLGFALECGSCHSTATWQGATFDHDGTFFPIYSGAHRGRWDACTDCHVTPANYQEFFCLGCHPHDDQIETDGHHREVTGYQYDSMACYTCHPRGNE